MTSVTHDLLRKYNVQGPRYTSYPPAPSWSQEVGPTHYEKAIRDSNLSPSPSPLSIYVHLPFCSRMCYFCGCTTLITGKNKSFEKPYLNALVKEIDWLGRHIDHSRPLVQLHYGGGTPTYSSADELVGITEEIKKHFIFAENAEMGIEVDPRVTQLDHLKKLRAQGFNRISMGVQDFDLKVQKAVNRTQSYEQTKKIVDEARSLNYLSINIDLIYGLPHQTAKNFETTVRQVLELNPDRLAVYSYAHVPWLKEHQEHFEEHLPKEQEKFDIFLTALKLFTEAGYEYIGMDHFAKPTDELAVARRNRTLWRNFMGYTTKAGTDLFGLGMSSIGSVYGGFFQNYREVKTYEEAIDKGGPATIRGFILSSEDKMRGQIIQNLLCHAVVIKSEIEQKFSIVFDAKFKDALDKLNEAASDGLVELTRDTIKPTEIGRIFLRNLAMPFDAYLPKPGEKKLFSKTI